MRLIENRVDAVAQIDLKRHPRDTDDIVGVVMHRLGESLGLEYDPDADSDVVSISKAFADMRKYKAGSYTGGEMGYHAVIHPFGVTEQALNLTDTAMHARNVYNKKTIGIACLGDFRKHGPYNGQWMAARALVTDLLLWLGPRSWVKGHTELGPSATADKSKECPGEYWNMNQFRSEVMKDVEIVRYEFRKDDPHITDATISKFAEMSLRRCNVTL